MKYPGSAGGSSAGRQAAVIFSLPDFNKLLMIKKLEKPGIYFLSFLLPVLIWLAVCVYHGIYPFGDKSIMTGDITYQFIDYLAYFKSIIFSNNDLSYTFSKTIGGDMAGFASYYLSSPFNFILIFFPNELLPLGLLIIIMIKSGCMSLFFMVMLDRIYGFHKRSLIFSVSYALMGYAVIYYQLYAYYDDMMLLPLIVLGIHRLLEDPRKKVLYTVSLSMAIILNYYIGWMLCIFSALYFIYRFIIVKGKAAHIISFVYSSLMSGALSAWVVIPAVLSLRGEKNSFHLGFYRTMDMLDLFSRFYTDSFKGNISTCLPNVYCGVLAVILLVFYFLNKNITKRERIVSFVFILFLCLNFYINTLNVIWHGLNRPIGFPYRYSFLLTFLMLLLSYSGTLKFDYSKAALIIAGCWGVFIAYSALILIRKSDVVGRRDIAVNLVILSGISLCVFLFYKRLLMPRLLIIFLTLIQLADLCENFRYSFYHFEFASMSEYQKYVSRMNEVLGELREKDPSFYRLEKTFKRSHNDSMQFNYAGLTHYSSCEKKEVISYMKKLGFRDNGNWAFYDNGSTAFVDSLFGIKYVISHYDYTGKKYKRLFNKKYEEENGRDKYFVNENQTALPLMFVSGKEILHMDTSDENPFEFQNKLADAVSGEENNIFLSAQTGAYELENLTEEKLSDGVSLYRKKDPDKEAWIEYRIKVTNENAGKLLEGYFDSPDYQDARIEMNGDDKGEYFSKYHWSVMDLSRHDEGEEIVLKIIPGGSELKLSGAYLYYEDMIREKGWFEMVQARECSLEKITSSHLKGYAWVPENEQQIVFSIPYEEDWEVYIDGEKVKAEKAAGILLSVPAGRGVHRIEMQYHQAGRGKGAIISLIALWIFVINFIYAGKKSTDISA